MTHLTGHTAGNFAFLTIVLCCAALLPSRIVRAESSPVGDMQQDTRDPNDPLLWAARVCYLEATWRQSDCVALLYVTQRRARNARRPWLDLLLHYSAINANNPRALEVRAFPWSDLPERSVSFNRNWRRLRDLVTEFAAGKLPNPCPRADHWGGAMDHARGRMVPAHCSTSTANTFYMVRR